MENKLISPKNTSLVDWAQNKLTTQTEDVVASFIFQQKSLHTQRSYKNDLLQFFQFLHLNRFHFNKISEINEEAVLAWKQFLISTGQISHTSLRRKLNTLSALFVFCLKRKVISENPLEYIARPKVKSEGKTNILTLEEIKKILKNLKLEFEKQKNLAQTTEKYRSCFLRYAVLATLFSVGMRVSELCNLTLADIEVTDTYTKLHLTTKGQKENSPIVPKELSHLLLSYIEHIRKNAQKREPLFERAQTTKLSKPITQTAIYKMITQEAKKAGINKKVSPHSCRASLATLLHNKGVPVVQIQALLNHKDITTTMIYIRKAEEASEAAATKIEF